MEMMTKVAARVFESESVSEILRVRAVGGG